MAYPSDTCLHFDAVISFFFFSYFQYKLWRLFAGILTGSCNKSGQSTVQEIYKSSLSSLHKAGGTWKTTLTQSEHRSLRPKRTDRTDRGGTGRGQGGRAAWEPDNTVTRAKSIHATTQEPPRGTSHYMLQLSVPVLFCERNRCVFIFTNVLQVTVKKTI